MVDDSIIRGKKLFGESEKIVVFTGSGISTESGIPDFRSEGGLWSKFDPSIYANYHNFLNDPSKYWELERALRGIVENAEPNPAHMAIKRLEDKGKLLAVITQNIDMLHQKSGLRSPIYELHGSAMTATCHDCKAKYGREEILEQLDRGRDPVCKICGSRRVKFDVVLFGEALPYGVFEDAINTARECDLFVIVGSSLLVSPANQLPYIAKSSGAKVIIVNLEPTMMDDLGDLVIHGKAGEVLPLLVEDKQS